MLSAPDLSPLVASLSSAALPIAIVLVLALLALRFARPLVRRVLGHLLERQLAEGEERAVALPEVQKRVDTLESVVVSATRLAVAALAALLLLVIFDLAPVVAGLGLAIAAFAFAGQEIVKDYLMGFLIILENQYYKGDVVTIGGVTGTVEDIALRRTTLRDLDGAVHVVHLLRETPTAAPVTRRLEPAPQGEEPLVETLTRRELEVLQLVADGLSNKQIGARLFISERTVENHVGSILNKLGFNSRAQIAAWIAASDH